MTAAPASPHVVAVCTGAARRVRSGRGEVLSAIGKQARQGQVAVGPLGLAGDEQADLAVHGGLSKAVYAYPQAHYPFWQTVRAQARVALWDEPLPPGSVGENLLLAGLTEAQLWVGDRLLVGEQGLELAVSEPRHPCHKFALAMGFAQAVRLMWDSGYCGAYLAVLQPGPVAAGDAVRLVPGPREVSVRELFRSRAPARGTR